jgi:hypothetical protein
VTCCRCVDVVYESGSHHASFNGDWNGQHLSERDYKFRFTSVDERYARMLAALIGAIRSQP